MKSSILYQNCALYKTEKQTVTVKYLLIETAILPFFPHCKSKIMPYVWHNVKGANVEIRKYPDR
jgi:hypothetical protein